MRKSKKAPVLKDMGRFKYGVLMKGRGTDGVQRAIGLRITEDGGHYFLIQTWWNGDDKPPLETPVVLSPEAMQMMMEAYYVLHADPLRWEIKDAPKS